MYAKTVVMKHMTVHFGKSLPMVMDGDGLPIMIEVCKNFVAQLDKGQQMCYNTDNAKEN